MTNQELSIMAAVCHKSAVELLKDTLPKDISFDDTAEAVDQLSRRLYAHQQVWVKELQNGNQTKTN